MSTTRELTPIPRPKGDVQLNYRNLSGPLRPPADRRGNLSITCPHCGAVLVEEATEQDVAMVKAMRCYDCRKWSTGEPAK